jgi:hypothetical protein
MFTREVPKSDWQSYFDEVNRQLAVMTVDVDVTAPSMGAQQEFVALKLQGLSYDPRDDAFSILAGSMEHRVVHPAEIFVEEDGRGLVSVQVIDGQGLTHLARFTRALPLPPPDRHP